MSGQILQLIEEWRDLVDRVLTEKGGMEAEAAEALSVDIVTAITDEWGGQQFYIPVDMARKVHERDLDIAQRYEGTAKSRQQLMREYRIGLVVFYQSLKRGRATRGRPVAARRT